MWHVCDDLHFASKMLHGDGSTTARIESIGPAHYATQVGLTIRSVLAPTAPHASVVTTPLGDVALQYRTTELGATQSRYAVRRVEFPCWLRLIRTGHLFTAEHSRDGVHWEPIPDRDPNQPASVEMPGEEAVYIGLTLASYDLSRNAEARISHVSTAGNVSPPGPFTQSRDIRSQSPR